MRFEGDEGWVETGDNSQIILSENLPQTLKMQFTGTGPSFVGTGAIFSTVSGRGP